MRQLSRTKQFKKDLKRESKGQHKATLQDELQMLVDLLVNDSELPDSYCDHPMIGEWKGFRDAHVKLSRCSGHQQSQSCKPEQPK